MKKNHKIILAVAGVAILLLLGAPLLIRFWSAYTPGVGNFQVHIEGYLREDLGANPIWNGHEVDVYRGNDFVETVTSDSAGKIAFAAMYWVGEVITVQVRSEAPGSLAATDPYLMAAVDITVPSSAEAGDTVSIGIVWGRDPTTTAPTMTCTNQTGGSIADTSANFLSPTDTELRVLLHTLSSGEGWGIEDEVIDLRTGYKYIGGIVVWKSANTQPISNYKWHFSAGSYEYYVLQPGRFADDPNIPDDGTAFCKFTFDANLIAEAALNIDAFDMQKWTDAENGVFGSHEVSGVTGIDTKIAQA